MHTAKLIVGIIGLGTLAAVTGCGTMFGGSRVVDPEQAFGHSTRNMIRTEMQNPAASNAAVTAPALDGEKAAAALKAYRAGTSDASSTSTPVNISIGE